MNDQEAKKWLSKSLVQTSDDFTDRLLHTIEAKAERKPPFPWPKSLVTACLLLALLLTSLFILGLSRSSPGLLSPPVLAGTGFLVLWLSYSFSRMKEHYQYLR